MHSMNWIKDVCGACHMDFIIKMGRGPGLEKVCTMGQN